MKYFRTLELIFLKGVNIGCLLLTGLLFMAYPSNGQTLMEDHTVIDFNSMLHKMMDREELARYPAGSWTLHHLSSYDRNSVSKDKDGWYANKDYDNFVRKDSANGKNEYVLMDVEGPGVITRFWVAGFPNKKAHLKFYMDGQEKPFWEADHTGALIGQNKTIGLPLSQRSVDRDVLGNGAHPGHNLYVPIPFKHRIKITYERTPWEGNNGFWYNIDYRLYDKGTAVTSFSDEEAGKSDVLKNTSKIFNDFMAESAKETLMSGEKTVKISNFNLSPGKSTNIKLRKGGAIRRILLSLNGDSLDNAVKNLWVQIKFDGKKTVEIPAGFFFGCGDQLVEARTWYHKVDKDGTMANYWVMPYQHHAEISLLNKGNIKLTGLIKVALGDMEWDNNTMYFHAQYKKMYDYMTEAAQGKDFNFINVEGKAGVYVGDILEMRKPVGGWWGEGDEKIYIDGSHFPDIFGTGTEDYYGYAWGHFELFNHLFISQPIGDGNRLDTGGITVNTRERNLDAIPFSKSLKFDLESWNWFGGIVNYSWACFWYEKEK